MVCFITAVWLFFNGFIAQGLLRALGLAAAEGAKAVEKAKAEAAEADARLRSCP
jgi:hypothetical protein